VALFVLSFTWSIAPAMTLRGLVEGLPELVFALATAAAWPIFARPCDARWLACGLCAATLLTGFEHFAGMPLHALVHARGEAWDLKRSVIPPAFLLWPAIEYFCARRQPLAALGLVLVAVLGIVFAHSGAPGFGLMAAATGFFAARAAPRATLWASALILGLLIVAAPWTGSIAGRALPARIEQALSEEHAAHRIQIWTAFELRVGDRPWLGHGFDTSFKVSTAARPGGLPVGPDNEAMVDNHPHDIALQIWVELGLAGGLAAAVAGLFVLRRLALLPPRALAVRLAFLITVIAVGLVGLSAWQPWWLASIAATLIWFDVTAERATAHRH
jgi:O-antigen ligase